MRASSSVGAASGSASLGIAARRRLGRAYAAGKAESVGRRRLTASKNAKSAEPLSARHTQYALSSQETRSSAPPELSRRSRHSDCRRSTRKTSTPPNREPPALSKARALRSTPRSIDRDKNATKQTEFALVLFAIRVGRLTPPSKRKTRRRKGKRVFSRVVSSIKFAAFL